MIRAAAFSFIGVVAAIVESVALKVVSNALSIGTLEFVSRAEAEGFVRVVSTIVDTIASHVFAQAESICTEESMDGTRAVVLI